VSNRPTNILRPSERGSIAIIVAVSLFAILGIATLAIDGGVLQNDRRDDQNVADHAALDAAFQYCNDTTPTQTEAQAAGLASANRNGFNNNGTTNTVTITGPTISGTMTLFEAEVRNARDPSFAGTMGASKLRAIGYAKAACTPASSGSGGYAIFANGKCGNSSTPPKTVDISGSTNQVEGAVHSNLDVDLGGSGNSIIGDTTYVTTVQGQSNDTLNPAAAKTTERTDPLASIIQIADFLPTDGSDSDSLPDGKKAKAAAEAGQYYNFSGNKIDSGLLESSGRLEKVGSVWVLDDGLYFTNQDIDLGTSDLRGDVTFVTSNGQLKISGSNVILTPYDSDGLLAFSNANKNCGEYGVAMSGSSNSWTGIVYAPRALVEMSGSDNSTLNGSLVGDEVRMNGSNQKIKYQNFSASTSPPSVVLLE
jgi:hypothetical protein